MQVGIDVQNDTNANVKAEKFVGIVSYGDRKIGVIQAKTEIVLPAGETTSIGLQFAVDNDRFLNRLSDILDGQGNVNDPFRIEGRLYLESGLTISMNREVRILGS